MRSILIRIAAAGVAGIVSASMIAPATAATRHKRAPAPAQSETSADVTGLPIRPAWSPVPNAVYQAPNRCFTDEGYGRYTSCEQGGF